MEQSVVTYTGPRMVAKRPGEIARLSLSHIARGSRGAMFFQWRASRGGAELWHSGMVPHAAPTPGSSARSASSASSCPPSGRPSARRSRPGPRSCGTRRRAGPCRHRVSRRRS
ncbi:beta-galactosidase [Streptosporangium lutulentum]